jgi:uncharacterized membrane protein
MGGWSSRIVNRISASALAVYLIAGHPLLLSPIWSKIFNMQKYLGNLGVYFAMAMVCSAVVMVVCIAVDMAVEFVIGKARGFIR